MADPVTDRSKAGKAGGGGDRKAATVTPTIGADGERLIVSLDPRSAIGVGVGVLGLFLVFALGRSSASALTLIGVGVLLAFALEPLVKAVQRRLHCSRVIGVAVVGAVVLMVFSVLVFVMGPPALKQAQRFGSELPKTVRDLYTLPIVGPKLEKADAATKVQDWAKALPGQLDGTTVSRTARTVATGATNGFTVVLVAFAVLLDGEVLVRRFRQVIPLRFRDRADDMGRVFYRVVGTYFAGSVLVACIGGTYTMSVGLALGVPLAPIAGLWYAMVSLIPQVGGFLGVSFFTILALSQGVFVGILGLAFLLLYMNLENYVITPAIVGQSVNLAPPTTMIAALIGGAALGVPGALAATPLCGTVKALYLEYRFGEDIDYGRKRGGLLRRLKLPAFAKKLLHRT